MGWRSVQKGHLPGQEEILRKWGVSRKESDSDFLVLNIEESGKSSWKVKLRDSMIDRIMPSKEVHILIPINFLPYMIK